MKKNKKLIIAAVIFALVICVFAAAFALTRPDAVDGQKTIAVEVVHSDGSSKNFEYTTQLENLGDVLVENKLIVAEDGPYGLYITHVDDERAVYELDGAYWCLYVGDEMATLGVTDTLIQDGDSYKLVYTAA